MKDDKAIDREKGQNLVVEEYIKQTVIMSLLNNGVSQSVVVKQATPIVNYILDKEEK